MNCTPAELEAFVSSVLAAEWSVWVLEWLAAAAVGYFFRWSGELA